MVTRTKQYEQIPAVAADDLSEAYIDVLGRRDAVRRRATNVSLEDGNGYYRDSANLAAADDAVRQARDALQAAAGPAAVRLAEARAAHRPIITELTAAQESWRSPGQIAELAARERAADLRVQQAATDAHEERARAATREMLEATHRPLLDQLTAGLTDARTTLAGAAQAALDALAALHTAADQYGAQTADARRQLAANGFDGSAKFDGQPWPSAAHPLRVQGVEWSAPHPDRVTAWTIHRAVTAHGWGGQRFDHAIRPLVSVDARIIEALLGKQTGRRAAK